MQVFNSIQENYVVKKRAGKLLNKFLKLIQCVGLCLFLLTIN